MEFVPTVTLFDEITDFLVAAPSPQEIIAYQASDALNERLHELLDKNKAEMLSNEERSELDTFLQMGHMLTVLKAKARLKLADEE